MAEPIGPFLGLDAADAVELGELLTFLSPKFPPVRRI